MKHEKLLEHDRQLPILTLQEISLVKIVTTLCNHVKLRSLILRCRFPNECNCFKLSVRNGAKWKAVEATANDMVSQICKSALLKKRMLEYLWPISCKIMVWKSAYAPRINNSFLQHFHWTERGRIDNIRTVQCLIKNRNISVRERFALACSVCSQNEIFEIWRKMSDRDKTYFYNGDIFETTDMHPLTDYWSHLVAEVDSDSEDYIDEALSFASRRGLLEAVKYLFAVAPENQIRFALAECMVELNEKILSGHLLEEDEKDIACIVYSHMTDDDCEEFFDDSFETALSLFLHSSKYKLCLDLLGKRLNSNFVYDYDIARALSVIFYTYHLKVDNDDECRILFMDFWRKIPTRMKKTGKFKVLRMEFLSVLIRDNFSFLLEKGAFQKIAELTSLDMKFNNSDNQVDFHQGKWNFLHFIIEEVITIPLLRMPKMKILFLLKKRPSDFAVCYRMFRFVSKVQRKSLLQKE